MTKSVLDVLDELESVGGRLKKEAILNREKDNEVLQKILYLVENPYVVFFVNKFTRQAPVVEVRTPAHVDSNMVGFYQFLLSLSRRESTGNAARGALESFLASSTPQEQKWMERVVLKNLRCGVQVGTIKKTWPDLVPEFEVQLANLLKVKTDKENKHVVEILTKVKYPVGFEPKLDGFRLVAMKRSGEVKLFTRNGSPVLNLPLLAKVLEEARYDDFVLDGEIFGTDFDLTSSVMLSDKNLKDETQLSYYVFDAIPVADWISQKCGLTFKERRSKLAEILMNIEHNRVQAVLGKDVESDAEMIEMYENFLSEGWEGGMVKDLDGLYNHKRSDSIMKLKPFSTHDGVITGWYEGHSGSKWEGLFGGFYVLLTNGVTTKVGGGFKEAQRHEFFSNGPSSYKGKIAEVEGQLLTSDGKIRFPRFKRFRSVNDVDKAVTALVDQVK